VAVLAAVVDAAAETPWRTRRRSQFAAIEICLAAGIAKVTTRVATTRVRKVRIVARNLAASSLAAPDSADLIIAAQKRRARLRRLRILMPLKNRSYFPVNPSRSIAANPSPLSAAPVVEQESSSKTSESTENARPGVATPSSSQSAGAAGGVVPRRFTGGLPRWLLADAGAESEAAPVSADENIGVADDSTLSAHGNNPPRHEASPLELPASGAADLNDDQIAALGTGLVEAKQEEVQEVVQAAAINGGAIFEEEEEEVEEIEEVEENQAEHEAEN